METKDVIDKKPESKAADTNPQILEMQQTIQEFSTQLEHATKLISEKDAEIKDMRDAHVKVATDKLEKEKDLKAAFGVDKKEVVKRSPDDVNSLSNMEMLEIIGDAVEGVIGANRQEASLAIDENFKGLESKFDQVVGHIMKTEANAELQVLRAQNKDFDNYKDEISAVLKKHQEFSLEEAYDWVKMKEQKGQVAPKHTDSEKPNKDLSAADEAVDRTKKQPEGRKVSNRKQFMDKVYAAIDTVHARRGEK